MNDTAPHIHELVVCSWRETPGWQKLAQIGELNALLEQLIVADIRRTQPYISNEALRAQIAERWLGRELARKILNTQA